jgi:hypothetical protein
MFIVRCWHLVFEISLVLGVWNLVLPFGEFEFASLPASPYIAADVRHDYS